MCGFVRGLHCCLCLKGCGSLNLRERWGWARSPSYSIGILVVLQIDGWLLYQFDEGREIKRE